MTISKTDHTNHSLDHSHTSHTDPSDAATVGACPMCGSFSGASLAQPPALLAVCDVLVVWALEAIGKRVVRADRSRYSRLDGAPWHVAHTLWSPDDGMVDKALQGAWDVVPAMLSSHGCCGVTAGQVTSMLDLYVRDLAITSTPHNLDDLRYRFETRLGISIPVAPEPYRE